MGISVGDVVLNVTSSTEAVHPEISAFINGLSKLEDAAVKASKVLEKLTEGSSSGPKAHPAIKSIADMARELGIKTTEHMRTTVKQLTELQQAMIRANAPASDLAAVSKRLAEAQAELATATAAPLRGFQAFASQAKSAVGQLGAGIVSAAAGFGAFAVGSAVFTEITGAIRDAAKASLEFNRAFANVSTIFDQTTKSLQEIKREMLNTSTEMGDATQIAESYYEAISSGLNSAEALKFTETANVFAQATLTDLPTAVRAITSAIHAYGYEVKDAQEVSDIFFQTIKLGVVRGPELANSIGQVMPIARSVGVPLRELTSLLAALTLGGLDFGESVTAMRQAMSNFIAPSEQAKKLAKDLHVEIGEAAMKTGTFSQNLFKLAAAANNAVGGQKTEAMDTFFGNIRAFTGVMSLTQGQAANLERISGIIGDKGKTAGGAIGAFNLQMDTLGKQIDRIGTMWDRIWQKAGADSGPIAQGLRKALNEIDEHVIADKVQLGAELGFTVAVKHFTEDLAARFGILLHREAQAALDEVNKRLLTPPAPPSTDFKIFGPALTEDEKELSAVQTATYNKVLALNNKKYEIEAKYKILTEELQTNLAGHNTELKTALVIIREKLAAELKSLAIEEKRKKYIEDATPEIEVGSLGVPKRIKELEEEEAALKRYYKRMVESNAAIYDQVTAFEALKKKTIEVTAARARSVWDGVIDEGKATAAQALDTLLNTPKFDLAGKYPLGNMLVNQFGQGFESIREMFQEEKRMLLDRADNYERSGLQMSEADRKRLQILRTLLGDSIGEVSAFEKSINEVFKSIPITVGDAVDSVSKSMAKIVYAMDDAAKAGLEAWILGEESFGEVMRRMLAQQLAQAAAECLILALKASAYGLYYLATMNWGAAAAAFESAAIIGGIGAGFGMAAAAINPPRSSSASEKEGYSREAPKPVTGSMVYQRGMSGGLSTSGSVGTIYGTNQNVTYNQAPASTYNVTIQAIDSASFEQRLATPSGRRAIVSAVTRDIKSNGPMKTMQGGR